jgi:hypothetical protein
MWLLFVGYIFVGYILINIGIHVVYNILSWLIESQPNPPEEWSGILVEDGAKRTFGLMFGWLYAIVYFAIWLIPVWVIHKVLKNFKR